MTLRIRSLSQLGKHVKVRGEERKRRRRKTPIPNTPSPPQQALWQLVRQVYPDAQSEKAGLVPGRRYTVDIVIERLYLVIEIDGWEYHGKYKTGFLRDREKDRALLLAGYRVVRFTAGEILKSPETVMAVLASVVEVIEGARCRRCRSDAASNER